MTLTEQVYAQAVMLADIHGAQQEQLLQLLCKAVVCNLSARLRDGITANDCKADFVAAGALYALAALSEIDPAANLQRMQVGDVTLVPGGTSAASCCLRKQADLMISPYCKDYFSFRGV